MRKLHLTQVDVNRGNLILVNEKYPISTDNSQILAPIDPGFSEILMKSEAVAHFQYILKQIGCNDEIIPVSGYRSATEQAELYEDSRKKNGFDFTNKYVAMPNHSEHQTGLAIDLGLNQEEIDFIRPNFPDEGICKAFRKAAIRYGFVERYPNEKQKITKIAYEPWHFRFVGYPHSLIMADHQLCLEEYIDYLKEFSYGKTPLRSKHNGQDVQVFYMPEEIIGEETICVPTDGVCKISGNNVDGIIISFFQ